jgi:hypothetical protein
MFRFSIRDVLWLTLLAALGTAWWLQWRGQMLQRQRDAATISLLKEQATQRSKLLIVPLPPAAPRKLPAGLRPIPGEWDYQAPPEIHRQLEFEQLPPLKP